jgi:hypothetical protein
MIIGHMSPVHLKQHMGLSTGSKREQTIEKQKNWIKHKIVIHSMHHEKERQNLSFEVTDVKSLTVTHVIGKWSSK